MEVLGHISFKKIFYCHIIADQEWFDRLPAGNWIAFVITDNVAGAFMTSVADKCLKKNATCICCAGQLAAEAEEYFSKEIIRNSIPKEETLKKPVDHLNIPMLTVHSNFSEGFWYATSIANASIGDPDLEIETVVCIDMTKNAVKKHLRHLIGKFNSGELPSDKEFEEPEYDSEIV